MFWHVEQQTLKARLVTDVTCPKSEMLLVNYESPDGAKRHNRLWNGGTGVGRVQLFEKRGGTFVLIDDHAMFWGETAPTCASDGDVYINGASTK